MKRKKLTYAPALAQFGELIQSEALAKLNSLAMPPKEDNRPVYYKRNTQQPCLAERRQMAGIRCKDFPTAPQR
jgi:hypothetical protein